MNEPTLSLPSLSDDEDKSSPFVNRIRKNYRHIRKWAKRTQTDCFRIYDRDIKEYPVAIDFYAGRFLVHYFASHRDEDTIPTSTKNEIENALIAIFSADNKSIYWKTRIRRKEGEQYEKLSEQNEFFTVIEYGVKFKVNLVDYLDTGLFLDHRESRRTVASMATGKRVLNLFAYTCSFSVHAALSGAIYTKSVDLSNTYTSWGTDNFLLNSINLNDHVIIRADCLKFLEGEVRSGIKYDIIIIDPPTLSRSKKMDQMFNIQQDHIYLVEKALQLLSPGGLIFFSTNSRKFSLDEALFNSCRVTDITAKTIPIDFHDKKIHRCWIIHKGS